MSLERLHKIIARAGIASRRKAEELIKDGRVTVNREVVSRLGSKVNLGVDRVEVDGVSISNKRRKSVYLLLNKPKGYICSRSDPQGRPIVQDLLKKSMTDIFPVGRLDYDAEGVLILTNDGDLTQILTHPNHHVPKVYHVKVRGVFTGKDLLRLDKGIYLEDGKTLPAKSRAIKVTKENSWIELTVYEGRNRLVKRMCKAVGHPVMKLKRIELAGLQLGALKRGEYRMLTIDEVDSLKRLAGYKSS